MVNYSVLVQLRVFGLFVCQLVPLAQSQDTHFTQIINYHLVLFFLQTFKSFANAWEKEDERAFSNSFSVLSVKKFSPNIFILFKFLLLFSYRLHN